MNKVLKVCYFGSYDPEYSRNRVLIKGLRQSGVEVIEIRDRTSSIFRYLKLFLKYLKMQKDFDIMIVGFPGQEMMFLARLLTRKLIIFDAFTSHYGGYILDRGYYSKHGLHAAYYRFMDTWSCRLADKVLLDTQAHIDFFMREFHLPPQKFERLFVGTDTDIFHPRESLRVSDAFRVYFHGHYIPLQGVETIIRAAKLLENEGVSFKLIGRGQTYQANQELARESGIKNIQFVGNVPYPELADNMAEADVCLGIFGSTSKTSLVIPNKLFEAIAMKKPVITADTPAVRELLNDFSAVLVKTHDPEALADGILKLKNDEALRARIAEKGYEIFEGQASLHVLGKQLIGIMQSLL